MTVLESEGLYRRLVAKVDAFLAEAIKDCGRFMRCGPGCSACCQGTLTVFPVEAYCLARRAGDLPARAAHGRLRRVEGLSPCVALESDRCLIYPLRPIICRTQGYPLWVREEGGERRVRHCDLNFRASDHGPISLKGGAILDLEALNEALVGINLAFVREWEASGGGVLPQRVTLLHFLRGPKGGPPRRHRRKG